MPETSLSSPASVSIPVIHRRGVLGTLALAGLGGIAGSGRVFADSSARGMIGKPKVSTVTGNSMPAPKLVPVHLPDLPEEWQVRQGAALGEYLKFLGTLKMQKVRPSQVIEAHAKSKGGVWNMLPPKTWWLRMGYTLRVVDRVAVAMNVSDVEIISAYRHPAYNARCAGARAGSWHQANVAADVKFSASPTQVAHAARYLRDKGLFKGGVGRYSGFTHIDTRGENADW